MNLKKKAIKGPFFRIVKKAILFLAILFLVDFSVGSILRHYYFTQDSGMLYETTYVLDSTKADMIIFGSSYANHHYSPEPFESRMNLSVYNAGRDGNFMFYHYAILKGVLKRYSPKKIILDFNFGAFMKDEISYESMSSLLPYYKNHSELRSIIQLRGPYEKYKLLSKVYPYNSLIFTIAVGNLDYNKTVRKKNNREGFVPLFRTLNGHISKDTFPKIYPMDTAKINIFKSFIMDCIKSNVDLYIVVSPRFIKYTHQDISILTANKIADSLNIPFFNYLNDPEILSTPENFADLSHMNDSGAKLFSNRVIDKILQIKNGDSSGAQEMEPMKNKKYGE